MTNLVRKPERAADDAEWSQSNRGNLAKKSKHKNRSKQDAKKSARKRRESEVPGSIEVVQEQLSGDALWTVRVFSEAAREGARLPSQAAPADLTLSVAAARTVPKVLSALGYRTAGDWMLDETTRSAWVNVVAVKELRAPHPSLESLDAVIDADRRWSRR